MAVWVAENGSAISVIHLLGIVILSLTYRAAGAFLLLRNGVGNRWDKITCLVVIRIWCVHVSIEKQMGVCVHIAHTAVGVMFHQVPHTPLLLWIFSVLDSAERYIWVNCGLIFVAEDSVSAPLCMYIEEFNTK